MVSEQIPRHNVIYNHYTAACSLVTVMCHGVRFQISASLHDFEHTSFAQEYLAFIEEVDDDDDPPDEENFLDWLLKPCYAQFRRLIPEKPTSITLQAFYYPTTYFLKLVAQDDSIIAKVVHEADVDTHDIMMLPSEDFETYPEIPRTMASDIIILPSENPNADHTCEFPDKVQMADGVVGFFKPAFDDGQIRREIEMHVRIQQAKFEKPPRTPTLRAIAVSDDRKMVIGLIFDLIPSFASNLESEECRKMTQCHEKWELQIVESLSELHGHEIVWGDVHPGNIVIDRKLDAWIVDFGGGWVERFLSREESGTKEGDWKAVRKIFCEWLKKSA